VIIAALLFKTKIERKGFFSALRVIDQKKPPAFMSVQPEKDKAQPLGIEKVFFDFDYCKNNEILACAKASASNSSWDNPEIRAQHSILSPSLVFP